MRIGLTYNLKPEGAVGDRYEEFDSLETIEALEGALRACGHHPVRLGWGTEMLDLLAAEGVDGVFNLAEGVGGRGRESQVPATLEMLGVPCTGSDPVAIGMTLDKALAKLMAKAHGIVTAPWEVVAPTLMSARAGKSAGATLRYPLFVKPSCEGSSMGVTAKSLCRNEAELHEAVARVGAYGPALIEEYLTGDEYTVGIVGGEVIAVMQVVPKMKEENFFYSIEVKRDYKNRVEYRIVDAPEVGAVALAIWRAFGLRDVARIDVRCDRDGVPNFVEVNPLPGVHPVNSDLVILAKAAGWTYNQLIAGIIGSAEERWAA
ncbi:MAG TPA: D-alanine--D-alanine ligase [Thermoanaerobaculia bacterium]|nr:D-alanine--D-alanine ligase [Thermoanaerobaculia bacterium]